jgi:glycosyltransferase involved in cell wall biosynthesis
VILLEFIRKEAPNNFLIKLIHPLWVVVFGYVLRNTVRYAHVLSHQEREHYSKLYGIPKHSLVYIPWPMRRANDVMASRILSSATSNTVVASGKASCDWETVFKAAVSQHWPLIVICGKRDFARVTELNFDNRAKVLCEITREEHNRYVREAAVYVLSLRETFHSSGHVRLSDCVREGTPVIATDVKAIEDYVIHNRTGVLIPPHDPSAMRCAIDSILNDRERGRKMARNAFELGGNFTREAYLEKIRCLCKRSDPSADDDKRGR